MTEEQKQQEAPQIEYEIKKKNKKTSHAINFESSSHSLPPAVKTQYVNAEAEWFKEDENILEFKAVKNELESYSYDLRNNIQDYGSLEKYIDPKIREGVITQIN